MECQYCNQSNLTVVCDLGSSPASNNLIAAENHKQGQKHFPLKVWYCESCHLVQAEQFENREDYFKEDYVYYSSHSSTWLKHCEEYANKMINDFSLKIDEDYILEIASNDGYLLDIFKKLNFEVLGVEPTNGPAEVAIKKGVNTIIEFFGEKTAQNIVREKGKPKLISAKNVLAHVPDMSDFLRGVECLLDDESVFTVEFPHLLQLLVNKQYDTVYHEHYSYLSLLFLERICREVGLSIFRIDEIPTHGGSLRVYADKGKRGVDNSVADVLKKEVENGLNDASAYSTFNLTVFEHKIESLKFFLELKKSGKRVAAYGAAAKGVTFLNTLGITTDTIEYVVDNNPNKQDKLLPGSRIPIVNNDYFLNNLPDVVVILPWNLKKEISEAIDNLTDRKIDKVVFIPNPQFL
jgi:hypothetical protein